MSIINDALLATLDTIYPRLTDSTLAWGKAISMFGMGIGLRGLWTMGATNQTQPIDVSGNGRTLTRNGATTYNVRGLTPYINMPGAAGQYLSRADEAGCDLFGDDTWIDASMRGVTVGGWFSFDRLTQQEGLVTKGGGAIADTNYALEHRGDVALDPVRFTVGDGVALFAADLPSVSITDWHFCIGRFVRSTSVDVYVDLTKVSNVAAITAGPLLNSAIGLNVGGYNALFPLDGRIGIVFIAGAAWTDAHIRTLYYHSRALYGR